MLNVIESESDPDTSHLVIKVTRGPLKQSPDLTECVAVAVLCRVTMHFHSKSNIIFSFKCNYILLRWQQPGCHEKQLGHLHF